MGFTPFTIKTTDDRTLFLFGACCRPGRHLYTTTAPSCCIPASYCHLSATLQTMSIIVVNLQDNRVVFRIFIALLRFSFDSPSYANMSKNSARATKVSLSHPILNPPFPRIFAAYFRQAHSQNFLPSSLRSPGALADLFSCTQNIQYDVRTSIVSKDCFYLILSVAVMYII